MADHYQRGWWRGRGFVLQAAAEKQDLETAAELGISNQRAARWRKRFLKTGMSGLERDAPRPGRKPTISAAAVHRLIDRTRQTEPANATHWSTGTMAAEAGINEASVRRIWRAND